MQPQPARRSEQVAPDAANEANVLNTRLAVGIFDSLDQARAALQDLEAAGYAAQDISVVTKNHGAAPHLGAEETHAHHGVVAGAGIGVALGGAAGLAALAGALAGGSVGGLVGSFVGLGVPTQHAEEYERAVRAGGIVGAVRAPTQAAADHGADILRQGQAREGTTFTAEM